MTNTRRTLIAILLGITTVGGVDAYLAGNKIPEPGWWFISSTIVLNILVFSWYHFDSNARYFRRSMWLNVAVVGVAFIAIPYYIFRSREKGMRAKALFKLFGFSLLCLGFSALGSFLGGAVGWP